MARRRGPSLWRQVQERLYARQLALKNGCVGLVPVCCQTCGRPIATTAWDRKRGEPPILFDFPEDAKGWTCTECAGPFTTRSTTETATSQEAQKNA